MGANEIPRPGASLRWQTEEEGDTTVEAEDPDTEGLVTGCAYRHRSYRRLCGIRRRQTISEEALAKVENLRGKMAAVLAKPKLPLLDESILDLPAPGIQAGEDVFLDEPPSVRDAFVFRGV